MKKLVTLLVCLVLVIGTIGMVGCGDSTFSGNYKEITADSEEVQQFSEKTAQSEMIDITKGAEIEVEVKGTASDMKIDLSANVKFAVVGEGEEAELQGEGKVKGEVKGEDGSGDGNINFYYTAGKAYVDGKINTKADGETNETELKHYLALDLEAGLGGIAGTAVGMISSRLDVDTGEAMGLIQGNVFANVVAMADAEEGIKVSLDADARKVKIELSDLTEEEMKISGAVYVVYDEDYNMSGIKVDLKVKDADGNELTVYAVIKGYTGKVSVPSEEKLTGYVDASLLLSAMFK